ncbi:hypothetical protein DQ384_26320 [Sphaerisporangium album]|uniref:Uncharacterized protein n=1 Tax=Sphaerisporangium album TaxID=509200 RepID=A0A367FA21_9ACTN|nr:hypothetical protein [Sphaerisporangium album]RCG27236.1 hypothetical protein DQ384_26320 [Sphaerisporangium album]
MTKPSDWPYDGAVEYAVWIRGGETDITSTMPTDNQQIVRDLMDSFKHGPYKQSLLVMRTYTKAPGKGMVWGDWKEATDELLLRVAVRQAGAVLARIVSLPLPIVDWTLVTRPRQVGLVASIGTRHENKRAALAAYATLLGVEVSEREADEKIHLEVEGSYHGVLVQMWAYVDRVERSEDASAVTA